MTCQLLLADLVILLVAAGLFGPSVVLATCAAVVAFVVVVCGEGHRRV